MKETHVVFSKILPAAPLATSASAMSISLSIGVFSIIPPIGLPPSWVAIIAGWLVVMSRHLDVHSAVAMLGLLQSSRGAGSAILG